MREHILALTGVAIKSAPGFQIKGKGEMRSRTKPFLGMLIVSPKENQRREKNRNTCRRACSALSITYFISSSDSNGLNLRPTQNSKRLFFFVGDRIAEIVSPPSISTGSECSEVEMSAFVALPQRIVTIRPPSRRFLLRKISFYFAAKQQIKNLSSTWFEILKK